MFLKQAEDTQIKDTENKLYEHFCLLPFRHWVPSWHVALICVWLVFVLKLFNSNECTSSEDTATDLRHSELLSLQVFPVWEEEQPASEEQLGWTSSLRQVTTFRQWVRCFTCPGPSAQATVHRVLTQINILLHLPLWDFDCGALTGRNFVHVSVLVVLPWTVTVHVQLCVSKYKEMSDMCWASAYKFILWPPCVVVCK